MKTFVLRGFCDELWSYRITYEVDAETLADAFEAVRENPEAHKVSTEEAEFTEVIRVVPDDNSDFEVLGEGE